MALMITIFLLYSQYVISSFLFYFPFINLSKQNRSNRKFIIFALEKYTQNLSKNLEYFECPNPLTMTMSNLITVYELSSNKYKPISSIIRKISWWKNHPLIWNFKKVISTGNTHLNKDQISKNLNCHQWQISPPINPKENPLPNNKENRKSPILSSKHTESFKTKITRK